MSMDDFFIGWSAKTPRADRRFLLGAGLALVAGGGALGASLALERPPAGNGVWDQATPHTLRGVLTREPYPILRTRDLDGDVRSVFLASSGKNLPAIDPRHFNSRAEVSGTLIRRGSHAMMAVTGVQAWPGDLAEAAIPALALVDRGPALLAGEILDAKCWFGAMRPGFGKTHKACASLCARGGLPLAFCEIAACGDTSQALLLLDESGRAHGPGILPLVADPVSVEGRLMAAGDVLQLRVPLSAIHRL